MIYKGIPPHKATLWLKQRKGRFHDHGICSFRLPSLNLRNNQEIDEVSSAEFHFLSSMGPFDWHVYLWLKAMHNLISCSFTFFTKARPLTNWQCILAHIYNANITLYLIIIHVNFTPMTNLIIDKPHFWLISLLSCLMNRKPPMHKRHIPFQLVYARFSNSTCRL